MNLIFLIRNLLSTIRVLNLGIICFSLLLVRYTIVLPILSYSETTSSVSGNAYIFLMLATVLIAAAGYVINDYFDTGIDSINKPGKNKTEIYFTKTQILMLYCALNFSGLVAGWYFGKILGIRYPVLLFIGCAGLLYFYSSSYKKRFLTGNLVIAVLSALTMALPILFDSAALHIKPIVILVSAYSLYAFLMTAIRELIKDAEDAEGDAAYGAATLAVVAGAGTARTISALITLLTSITIIYIQIAQSQWENRLSFGYTILFIQLPLWFLAFRIFRSKNKKDDHQNSTLAKLIMLTGLLSMLVFYITSG